jgi:hypothetical protein
MDRGARFLQKSHGYHAMLDCWPWPRRLLVASAGAEGAGISAVVPLGGSG